MRGPSFTGLGKRPDFTPAHQVDLLTGIGPAGAKMEERRRNPPVVVEGKLFVMFMAGSFRTQQLAHKSTNQTSPSKNQSDASEFSLHVQ
jgi:hypothetical protein